MIPKLLKKYGQPVKLDWPDGTSTESYALIEPLRYKNKMYLEDKRVALGIGDMSYYLYLGPAGHDLSVLDADEYMLKSGNEKYVVTRAERLYYSDGIAYIWAVIKRVKEEE